MCYTNTYYILTVFTYFKSIRLWQQCVACANVIVHLKDLFSLETLKALNFFQVSFIDFFC